MLLINHNLLFEPLIKYANNIEIFRFQFVCLFFLFVLFYCKIIQKKNSVIIKNKFHNFSIDNLLMSKPSSKPSSSSSSSTHKTLNLQMHCVLISVFFLFFLFLLFSYNKNCLVFVVFYVLQKYFCH